MPSYEYECQACDIIFEELLISSDDITKYSESHPCPSCGEGCGKIMSAANFNFKGKAFGDPTNKHGSSGVHDLDYPSLDKAIGRSSNRKWQEYKAKKKARDQARQELGTNAVIDNKDGSFRPVDSTILDAREKGLKIFKKIKAQESND